MTIRIHEVQSSGERLRFIKFPWKIYRNERNWVPPLISERQKFLNPKRNPFFEHSDVSLFMAHDNAGNALGRIAGIVNRNHIEIQNEKAGFFGLFESVDDPEVAGRLFDAAADFLRSKGMTLMRGPANMSVNDDLGLLIKGFDTPPVFMMPYNPQYYVGLVENYGFRKAMDLIAYYGESNGCIHERLLRGVELSRKRYKFSIRTIDMRDFDQEVKRIRDLYNRAWERNWGAVAMTDKEFDYVAQDLKQVIDPGLCLIAEVGGITAGFSLALPDFNQVLTHLNGRLFPLGIFKILYYRRRINAIRVITMGVLPEYRRMGLDVAFMHATYERSLKKGYYSGEMSWVLESNACMNNSMINLGYVAYKTYRVYDFPL